MACVSYMSELTNAEMSVDASVAGSSGEVLVLPIRDVLVCSPVPVLLC